MSESSRTPKPSEGEFIPLIQFKATEKTYREWVMWMRENFSYSQAVRMCRMTGHCMPGHGFYIKMRAEGVRKLQEVAA